MGSFKYLMLLCLNLHDIAILSIKIYNFYPNHKRYIRRFEKVYKNSRNAEEFIKYGIAIINAKK